MNAIRRLFSPNELTALDTATEWLNSAPLTAAALNGKVILVDFWTYSCINWLRTLPYVRGWAKKYENQDLVVIGVHTPEFPFEHDIDNVRRAVRDMQIDYPIVVDNDYRIWRAFSNNYWPAVYLVDTHGRVQHHHYGEGEYERTESVIEQMLTDAGVDAITRDLVSVSPTGVEAAADWENLGSVENYLGYQRSEGFASPGGVAQDQRRVYEAPEQPILNHWGLAGDWTIEQQAAVLNEASGRIVYRFRARDLHLVLGSATRDAPVRFAVRIDGRAPGAAHGIDIDPEGNATIVDPRLYQLIRQPGPIVEHTFEITFLDPGARAYVFTFG